MSNDPIQAGPRVHPRPGLVKTVGICNIIFSVVTSLCVFTSTAWLLLAMGRRGEVVTVQATATTPAPPTAPGAPGGVIAFNPFMGMDDVRFIRFCYADMSTALALNALMFASGIGLINLRRWGARWWTALAWTKIVRLFLLWGIYIVAVAPSLSEHMATSVTALFRAQNMPANRMPSMADLARVYSIMNLIVAVSVILLGSIYPAVTLWLLSRPGAKAALVDKPSTEPEIP